MTGVSFDWRRSADGVESGDSVMGWSPERESVIVKLGAVWIPT